MKKLLTAAAVLLAVGASGQALARANICLRSGDIENTNSPDGKVLMFRMKNGTLWSNTLQGGCPGLQTESFAWTLHGIDDVCENVQTLMLQTGETCMLGKFTKVSEPKH